MDKLLSKLFSHGIFEIYDSKPVLPKLIHVNQTHSNKIIEYNEEDISNIEADGIIFRNSLNEVSFAVKTADCLPVLFLGKEKSAIVHAGWRGVKDKILVTQSLQELNPYLIYIGPSIQVSSFEVQDDFKVSFPESKNFEQINNKLYFNLQDEAIDQMLNVFKNCQISNSGICTFEELNYNSYRRNKTHNRNWNTFTNKR